MDTEKRISELGFQDCGRCGLPYPVELLTATIGGRCLCPRCLGIVSPILVRNEKHKPQHAKGNTTMRTPEQIVKEVRAGREAQLTQAEIHVALYLLAHGIPPLDTPRKRRNARIAAAKRVSRL